ncbi:hypothetical protein OVY29_21230 [Sphingopyxis sp. SE2]|uniref:hypothetical protein n=1 Tax=Sphingopyxis sp. SE2 TaxID=1586240 RepID=UPI0028C18E6E|nr:hypothetical protein [Sphingopyxis sp. SE2]MDT7531193.1 hypothetical protein [Sphingopyxis sp. SE2]
MLEEQDYATLKPSQLVRRKVRLHPATRIARFETPAVTIWQAHRAGGEFEELEPEWKAESALVTRRSTGISVNLIDEAAHAMLAAIKSGRSLGSAITATAESHPDADLSKSLTTIISTAALTIRPLEDGRLW